jgi:hypothetical protein
MEVMMMRRYRNRQAWTMASRGIGISRALRLERKIDHHDRILLTMPMSTIKPIIGDDAKLCLEDWQRQDSAYASRRQRRQKSDWMNAVLVENA